MLENVAMEQDGDDSNNKSFVPNFFDTEKTQNGRVSYPIHHIDNFVSRVCKDRMMMFTSFL